MLSICAFLTSLAVVTNAAAEPIPYHATLRIVFPSVPLTVTATATGVAEVDLTNPLAGLPFALSTSAFSFAGANGPISLSGYNDAGLFSGPPPSFVFRGEMGLLGTLDFAFSHPLRYSQVISTPTPTGTSIYTTVVTRQTQAVAKFGLSKIGIGGTVQRFFATSTGGPQSPIYSGVTAQLQAGEWLLGKVGFGSAATTGFDDRDDAGVGRLQLVTPIRIASSFGNDPSFGPFVPVSGYGRLRLDFAPEPVVALASSAAIGSLLVLGWRRSNRTASSAQRGIRPSR
jgi:hypothetical protein